jgi:hypothetical protein
LKWCVNVNLSMYTIMAWWYHFNVCLLLVRKIFSLRSSGTTIRRICLQTGYVCQQFLWYWDSLLLALCRCWRSIDFGASFKPFMSPLRGF